MQRGMCPHLAAGERGNVLQVGLAVVAEAGCLDGRQLNAAAQLVHDQRRERLRLHILGHDEQRALRLDDRLQDGQQRRQPARAGTMRMRDLRNRNLLLNLNLTPPEQAAAAPACARG